MRSQLLWGGLLVGVLAGCIGPQRRLAQNLPEPTAAALAGVEAAHRLEIAWGGVAHDPAANVRLQVCAAALHTKSVPELQLELLLSPGRNAFSLPENRVYLTCGLYDALSDAARGDELLTAAIAHEIAHLLHGDSLRPCREPEEMLQREIAADRTACDLLTQSGRSPLALRDLLVLISADQPPEWRRRRLGALEAEATD